MVIISAAEIQTMIIAANIPSFKALWVQGLEFKVFWGSSRSRDTNKGPSNNYELSRGSNQQRVSKQRKEPGIDTELGLRDGSSQEELCAISTNGGDRGRIQVTTDVVVSSDRGTTSESEEMVLEQKRAYYDVGRDVHAK
jgi:hypothetical protein